MLTHVCRLIQSLYGLKQAPRASHSKFIGVLPILGFVSFQSDASLFVIYDGSHVVILLLYVDDIILTSSNIQVQQVINNNVELFELKDMGPLTCFWACKLSTRRMVICLFTNLSIFKIWLKRMAWRLVNLLLHL